MSASAQIHSGGLVSLVVKSEGSAIPGSIEIRSVHVTKAINRISTATLVILDGDAAREDFPTSSSSIFVPGVEIEIQVGYDNKNKIIFNGVVTGQTLRVDDEVGSALEVECRDKAVKMTIGRKSNTYLKMTDSDVISKLIENSGLSKNVTSTSPEIPELVQYYCSDWDFMLARAEINGLLVNTNNGKISIFKHDANTSPVLNITYGKDLYSINADLNAVTQFARVKASAWDYKSQQLLSAQSENSASGPGNLSSKKLSAVIGLNEYELQTTAALDDEDLGNWAKAQMLKSEYSKITGEVKFQGSAKAEPGDYITLGGLGGRFNGNHIASGVTHDIADGNWVTEIGFGVQASWFMQVPDVMAPAAAGLLPGVQGLYNATVKKNYDDPESEFRVLVDLPLLDPTGQGLWARLSNFYSTNSSGAFFVPEIGDEVIVGFLNQDPRYPVILGSVYSTKNKPYSELSPDEKNTHKAIITKSDLRIVFNDDKKVITITTPQNNKVVLDDDNKQISISDQNENSIVMSESGIEIKSPKTISIQADEEIKVSGESGVSVASASGDVSTSGMNIKESAEMEYSAEGSMTASVQGGNELTLKAAMVMIN